MGAEAQISRKARISGGWYAPSVGSVRRAWTSGVPRVENRHLSPARAFGPSFNSFHPSMPPRRDPGSRVPINC